MEHASGKYWFVVCGSSNIHRRFIADELKTDRNSKQCRERWSNQVNPALKKGKGGLVKPVCLQSILLYIFLDMLYI